MTTYNFGENDFPGHRCCYLLHFPVAISGACHYLGMTHRKRLKERMLEHAIGRGSHLTRRLVEINSMFYLVRIWPNAQPDTESMLKLRGHYDRECSTCGTPNGKAPLGLIDIPQTSDEDKALRREIMDLAFPDSEGWKWT